VTPPLPGDAVSPSRVNLQLTPINSAPSYFFSPWGCTCANRTPWLRLCNRSHPEPSRGHPTPSSIARRCLEVGRSEPCTHNRPKDVWSRPAPPKLSGSTQRRHKAVLLRYEKNFNALHEMQTRLMMRILSVCQSARPSVKRVDCDKNRSYEDSNKVVIYFYEKV